MQGVGSASWTTPTCTWVAEFGGSHHEWDAEITEQKPDERVA